MKIDLWDLEGYRRGQPIDQLMWLQEHAPVYWHHEYDPDGPGFWAVTKHADIKRVGADQATFSNEPSITVDDGMELGARDGIHKNIIMEDDPAHRPHRAFMGRDLTTKGVRGLSERVERTITEILDGVAELGECDVNEDIGGRVASYVTADLLGLPRELIVELYHISERLNNTLDYFSGDGAKALAEMGAVSHSVWEQYRGKPDHTLISHIVNGVPGVYEQDEMQFGLDFIALVDGGSDTTRNVIGAGLQAFFDHPEQRALLLSDPSLAASAADEVLRYCSPVVYMRRTATVDTEIRGQRIEKGQKVLMFYPAGNRDPEVFDRPMEFDITRNPNPHVGFGSGKHMCLGMHLAKMELTIVFRELLRRFPDIEPNGEAKWLWLENPQKPPFVCGPRYMPVRFTPAPRILDTAAAL